MCVLVTYTGVNFMMGDFMEQNPQQHPCMYYVLNTHHQCCNSNMILFLITKETSRLDGNHMITSRHRSGIKILNHLMNSSFFAKRSVFLQDMANSRFDIGKSSSMSQAWSVVNGHIRNKSINLFTMLFFRANRTIHSQDRGFYHLTLNFEFKNTAEMKENLLSNFEAK